MMDDTDHLYLTRYEIKEFSATLTTLRNIWHELENTMTRQTHYIEQQRVKTADDSPLPYHPPAAEHLRHATTTLNAIAETIAHRRHLPEPGYINTPTTIHWLEDHIIDLALMEDAPVYFNAITTITTTALRLSDRPRSDRVAGMCTACDAVSRFNKEDEFHTCPHCQVSAPTEAFINRLNEVIEQSIVDRKGAAEYLKDRNINRRTRARWLDELGEEMKGHTVYRVSELHSRVRSYLKKKAS